MVKTRYDQTCDGCKKEILGRKAFWKMTIYKERVIENDLEPLAAWQVATFCTECVDEQRISETAQKGLACCACGTEIRDGANIYDLSATKTKFIRGISEPEYGEMLKAWCEGCSKNEDLISEAHRIVMDILGPNARKRYKEFVKAYVPARKKHCGAGGNAIKDTQDH